MRLEDSPELRGCPSTFPCCGLHSARRHGIGLDATDGWRPWDPLVSRRKGSATQKLHERVYGKDFPYEKFAEMLTAELFEANEWADLFVRSGAKYVVTTANYHDGFRLWPSPSARASCPPSRSTPARGAASRSGSSGGSPSTRRASTH